MSIKESLSIKGAMAGAKEIGQAIVSKHKANRLGNKLVNSMVGGESTFGRVNQKKQYKKLKELNKANNFKGMRDYMADQNKKAGIKKVKGKESAI